MSDKAREMLCVFGCVVVAAIALVFIAYSPGCKARMERVGPLGSVEGGAR